VKERSIHNNLYSAQDRSGRRFKVVRGREVRIREPGSDLNNRDPQGILGRLSPANALQGGGSKCAGYWLPGSRDPGLVVGPKARNQLPGTALEGGNRQGKSTMGQRVF